MASAAAAFASLVGSQCPDAALALTLPDADDGGEERTYVVVLHDGVPVADEITSVSNATNLVGSVTRVYADDDVRYPKCELVDLDWLAQGLTKSARVLPIPPNPVPIVVTGLVVLALAGTWFAYKHKKRIEAERAAAEAAAKADPVPKYLGALAAQKTVMASKREEFASMALQTFNLPVAVSGWRLEGAECTAREGGCVAQWRRAGGTFADLRAAMKGYSLQYVTSQQSGIADLDLAQTRRSFAVGRTQLGTLIDPIPSVSQVHELFAPSLQVWRTAQLATSISSLRLWPAVPEVPATFTHPQALQAGDFVVRDIPGPFLKEVLQSAPSNVSWERLKLTVEGTSDPKTRLKFELNGTMYVANAKP
ncbi:MAG: hypothetical protein ACK5O3_13955 [Burkholderiales bacterium]|jgi:hypothetical protein